MDSRIPSRYVLSGHGYHTLGKLSDRYTGFQELASALKTAQPKIQKMIEEESDDTDAVVKLLELNDIINTTVERYTLTKRGNLDAARALPLISGQFPPASAESSSSAAPVETSLIDLDNDLNGGGGPSVPNVTGKAGSLEDDLLGLSFQDNGPFGQGGGIALGFGANTGRSIFGPLIYLC